MIKGPYGKILVLIPTTTVAPEQAWYDMMLDISTHLLAVGSGREKSKQEARLATAPT